MGLAEARRIARSVSERGGGLPAVEAMALPHGDGAAHGAVKMHLLIRGCVLQHVKFVGRMCMEDVIGTLKQTALFACLVERLEAVLRGHSML